MSKSVINTSNAPAPIGPYSQAVQSGNLLFVSGQIPIDPASGQLVNASIELETEQVMKNIGAILQAAGLDFTSVVNTTILLSDMALFGAVNTVYGAYFEKDAPARACFAVKELPKSVNVEISVIADASK